ncbi:uncharacterized protein LOC133790861 isoform X1 [Humulus lupulus]|uniref:uncharacterized protein LOC133790861 isoform X1 n=1 Tax=Humulus lupulus TaxID=3486 RepID=UPI002B40E21E|nr:uncharacterized protein LOC133790861 isoform X1 [Humulus lupulus]
MADKSTPPIRLMNFISEDQLDETKKARGERVEDGTAQRDRPLFEILKENKDKKDAEFNERFKHRPPKALDDDETEFLDKLELSKREYEKQVACEEAQQLRNFQAAVAAQSMISQEFEETPPVPVVQEQKVVRKKNPHPQPLGVTIKVKPQAKKAKLDQEGVIEPPSNSTNVYNDDTERESQPANLPYRDTDKTNAVVKTALVSYSDESEEDD